MKLILNAAILSLCAAAPAFSADRYTTFRVCEDKHVIHTSDGADAGHVEYLVVDPDEQRIVSTVVTGGIIGQRHVFVPYDEMQFGEGPSVTLRDITRERFVAAPVVETRRFTSSSYIEPSYVEPAFTYFGVGVDGRRAEGVGGRVNGESVRGRTDAAPGSAIDPRMREGSSVRGAGAAGASDAVVGAAGAEAGTLPQRAGARTATPGAETTAPSHKTGGESATAPQRAGVHTPTAGRETTDAPGPARDQAAPAGKSKSSKAGDSAAGTAKEPSGNVPKPAAEKGAKPSAGSLEQGGEKASEAERGAKAERPPKPGAAAATEGSAAETRGAKGAAKKSGAATGKSEGKVEGAAERPPQ